MNMAENSASCGDGFAAVTTCEQTDRGDGSNGKTPTTKAVSQAVNRAVERARREFEQRSAADREQLSRQLTECGLAPDPQQAVLQLAARKREIELRGNAESLTAERDAKLLGEADADEVIAQGDGRVETMLQLLRAKPVSERTLRDKRCYERLCRHRGMMDERAQLGGMGIDVDALSDGGGYAEFSRKLDEGLSAAEKYELYKKHCQSADTQKFTPPQSVRSSGEDFETGYFTPEQVDAMTPAEVEKNLSAITASMPKWGKRKR